MGGRAAVFTHRSPEVYADGAWWPGSILGWRHDEAGGCQVRVRLVVAGTQETTWSDLAALRLPERHLTVAPEQDATLRGHAAPGAPEPRPGVVRRSLEPEPRPGVVRRSLEEEVLAAPEMPPALPLTPGPGSRRPRHGGDVTAELLAVRPEGPGLASGWHRAPAGGGRHRATEGAPPRRRPNRTG